MIHQRLGGYALTRFLFKRKDGSKNRWRAHVVLFIKKDTCKWNGNPFLIRVLVFFSVFAPDIPLKIASEQRPHARHPHFASSADEDVSRGNAT